MSDTVTVAEVKWIWRDRWSGPSDDGYSYHVDLATAQKYVNDYWESMPDSVPEEYRSPDIPILVEVNPVFAMLLADKGTIETPSKMV